MTHKLTPTPVSGLTSGMAAISAGGAHTCALTTAGGVLCWGWNYYGQLGDGTMMSKSTPAAVNGLAGGAAALGAGYVHTCALTTAGRALCWGSNDSGQLGDGTTRDKSTPAAVIGLANGIAAISAGGNHTCALIAAGGALCWGNNDFGQLGDGTTRDKGTPTMVSGLASGVAAISAGGSHTCALTSAGGALCWGNNDSGQLGDGTMRDKSTPAAVSRAGKRRGRYQRRRGSHLCADERRRGVVLG